MAVAYKNLLTRKRKIERLALIKERYYLLVLKARQDVEKAIIHPGDDYVPGDEESLVPEVQEEPDNLEVRTEQASSCLSGRTGKTSNTKLKPTMSTDFNKYPEKVPQGPFDYRGVVRRPVRMEAKF